MSQTRENRMLRHYRSLKKQGPSVRWMTLARTWGMSIREVKEVIRKEKEK